MVAAKSLAVAIARPGTYGAGFDNDNLDAGRGEFASQRITDRFERELRARVRTVGGHGDLVTDGAAILLTAAHGAAGLETSGLLRTDEWDTTADELIDTVTEDD
jgi:hypothetical protein